MLITNNNREFMRVNEYTTIDHDRKKINDKYYFNYALNDHDTLVMSPSAFDNLKRDIMEVLDAENKNKHR